MLFDVIDRLRQFRCGHTEVFRFGEGRVWLECLECGRQSPGVMTNHPATGALHGPARLAGRIPLRTSRVRSAA
jgi:hypothetical protein